MLKMKRTFSIKLSGPAGAGMMQAGETLSKALNRLGFYTLMYPEYPSRIRGGDNNIQIVFSKEEFLAPQEKIDLLLAFGPPPSRLWRDSGKGKEVNGSEVGLEKIVEELGNPLALNTAGLGFLWGVLGFEIKPLLEQIKEDFSGKKDIAGINVKAAGKGYELSKSKSKSKSNIQGTREPIINLTGNEALVKGVLAGGCEFAAIYPMTPINSILTMLAREKKIKLFRPEDEIAGIMSAIGASYAGKRAMVATSGGGFSLMIEGVGMAGMAEIPLVVVLGQRTGPSSGIATYSSQSDLNFAIYGGHGEFPRIILTPGDLTELYELGAEAFNLAERYQVPVILMTDKFLAESRFSVDEKELRVSQVSRVPRVSQVLEDYKRYKFTESGISSRALPGETTFLTNSYEHDEFGFSSDEAGNRKKMMEKRMGKLVGLSGGFGVFGGSGGKETTLISWGSTKNILLDFIKEHPEFGLIHIWRPWPFSEDLKKLLDKQKDIIVVEGNYSGQMADLIEREIKRKVKRVLKDDGRPFFREKIDRLLK